MNTREHKTIDYWETVKTVVNKEKEMRRGRVILNIVVQRPVFVGGEMGYYRLSTFLKVNDRFLRLGTKELEILSGFFADSQENILDAVDEIRKRNDKIEDIFEEYNSNAPKDRFRALANATTDDPPIEYPEEEYDDNPEDDDEEYDESDETSAIDETDPEGQDSVRRRTRQHKLNSVP